MLGSYSSAWPRSLGPFSVCIFIWLVLAVLKDSRSCWGPIPQPDIWASWSAPQDPQMEKRPCIANLSYDASPGPCWRCFPYGQRVERWALFGLGLRCSGCSPPLNSLGRTLHLRRRLFRACQGCHPEGRGAFVQGSGTVR